MILDTKSKILNKVFILTKNKYTQKYEIFEVNTYFRMITLLDHFSSDLSENIQMEVNPSNG
jgi:hypothetical protein